jgi:hypothetical protein
VICNGTFTSGHVDASCFDEIVRVLEPGGLFAAAIHDSVWVDGGFAAAIDRMSGPNQALQIVEMVASPYYETSPGNDGRFCVFIRQ